MLRHPDVARLESKKAIARYIGVTVRTLDRWCAAGNGPPFCQFGGRRYFDREEVDRWIAAGLEARQSETNKDEAGQVNFPARDSTAA